MAAGLEAVSNTWNFNAYALVPVGKDEQQLNSVYQGGALDTYGLDVGYSITPDLRASVGYYHQYRSEENVNGSGVRGRLAYNLTNGLTVGANLSCDQAFETRVSADLKYRFGANGYGAPSIRKQQPVVMPVIQALSATPANRDVRLHDFGGCYFDNLNVGTTNSWRGEKWSWDCYAGISYEWGAIKKYKNDNWISYWSYKRYGIEKPGDGRNGSGKRFHGWSGETKPSNMPWEPPYGGVCEKPGVRC